MKKPRTINTAAIIAAYQNGSSLTVIATTNNTDVKVVKRILAEAGVEIRKRDPKAWMRCWH